MRIDHVFYRVLGEGVDVGSVLAGSAAKPTIFNLNTHVGHAFRLQSPPEKKQHLSPIAHDGGTLNIVVVAASNGVLNSEYLNARTIRKLANNLAKECSPADEGSHSFYLALAYLLQHQC